MVFRQSHQIHPLDMNRVVFSMHNQELIANQSSALTKPQEKLQKAKNNNLLCMGIYLSCRGCIIYVYVIGNVISHMCPMHLVTVK
jgi:L-asparagine transporter-like permease